MTVPGASPITVLPADDEATPRDAMCHLVSAGEEERRRIAADIHDDSIQAMTAAGLRLELLRGELRDEEQLRLLAGVEKTIELAVSRLRRLIFDLRPPALDSDGLAAALRLYVDQSQPWSRTTVHFEDALTSQPGAEVRIILYRIAREALANVGKHAQAAEAAVLLAERDGGYLVRIADDGVGFAPADTRSAPGHLGLTAMRERAELAGGRIRIDSAPGTGTVVECWIPALTADAQNGHARRRVG